MMKEHIEERENVTCPQYTPGNGGKGYVTKLVGVEKSD